MTRTATVLTILGLAAYVTSLQKKVIDPVLGAFRDLPASGQLAILAGIVAVGVVVGVVRSRRRRASLLRAVDAVAAHGSAGART